MQESLPTPATPASRYRALIGEFLADELADLYRRHPEFPDDLRWLLTDAIKRADTRALARLRSERQRDARRLKSAPDLSAELVRENFRQEPPGAEAL